MIKGIRTSSVLYRKHQKFIKERLEDTNDLYESKYINY